LAKLVSPQTTGGSTATSTPVRTIRIAAPVPGWALGTVPGTVFPAQPADEVSEKEAVMTTLDVVPKKKPEPSLEETAAKELVRQAREQGLSLTGPDGLLKQFTKSVLETALNEDRAPGS
jgi:hypothetical protein